VLKDKWSPALQMRTILMSVQALLDAPVLEDPLDTSINDHYLKDRAGAEKTAREWTHKYAKA
jgi:ubiquitin-conjugating enzyme E2 N